MVFDFKHLILAFGILFSINSINADTQKTIVHQESFSAQKESLSDECMQLRKLLMQSYLVYLGAYKEKDYPLVKKMEIKLKRMLEQYYILLEKVIENVKNGTLQPEDPIFALSHEMQNEWQMVALMLSSPNFQDSSLVKTVKDTIFSGTTGIFAVLISFIMMINLCINDISWRGGEAFETPQWTAYFQRAFAGTISVAGISALIGFYRGMYKFVREALTDSLLGPFDIMFEKITLLEDSIRDKREDDV